MSSGHQLGQDGSDLSPGILQWVADAMGPGTTIEAVRRVEGATSSTLHRMEAQHNGRAIKLVLRRFTNETWLQEEPDVALHEAASLRKVQAAGVPTPELVACDPDGTRCGVPAVLMTELPGVVDLKPADREDWLRQQAQVLLPIHAVDAGTYRWRYAPYNDIARLKPPGWSKVPKLWQRVLEIVSGPRPEARECFIHRDYHPTNVLWKGSRISGIVDWANACLGPAMIDVAWCRANLAGLFGVAVADQFLHAYESVTASNCDYDPYWDLMVIMESLPGPPDVYPPWITFGVHGLSDALMLERKDEYLASVMARF